MSRWPKPVEGSWTEHYPELGTGPVSYEDSVSPEFFELEREAIFKRAWLNVGRVEQICPAPGATSPRSSTVARTSIMVVRDSDGGVRAFHNICRHRGNKLVWNDFPREERAAPAASSPASTTVGATASTAPSPSCSRRADSSTSTSEDYGLVPVQLRRLVGVRLRQPRPRSPSSPCPSSSGP